jgi:hypothetical protein
MWVADPESAGCNNGTGSNWSTALTFANGLTFAGFSDWRMPNVKEMISTVRFQPNGGYYTYVDDFGYLGGGAKFPDRKDFWTSTSLGTNTAKAYIIYVDGYAGIVATENKTYNLPLVRPVRDV